jgi:hypothetical protein
VLCLVVAPPPPGKTPFAVRLNNNNMNFGERQNIRQLAFLEFVLHTIFFIFQKLAEPESQTSCYSELGASYVLLP